MRDLAQAADRGPWERLWVYDHFHTVPEPTEEATHEAWSLMSAFGAVTERIRLGQMCTCMGYRNPAYLAKVAATADIVSGGRVEMGIGAGWYEHEWNAYGYGFPTAGRAARRCSTRACRSCASSGRAARPRWSASTTRCAARSAARFPCRTAGSRCGSPAAGRRRRCGSRRSTRSTPTSTPRRRSSGTSREVLAAALQGRRHRVRRDHPLGQLQRHHRRRRAGRRGQVPPARGALRASTCRPRPSSATSASCAAARSSARPSRWSRS